MSRSITALLVATLAFAGCSFDRSHGYRTVNACASDDECSTGLCFEGVCASPPERPLQVTLQIITGSEELERAPASTLLPPFEVSDNGRRDLDTSALARVSGKVRFGEVRVPALLVFTQHSEAPGAPTLRVEVDTGDPFGDGSVDYVASLPAGEPLDLEVRVSGALFASTSDIPELDPGAFASRQLPPLRFRGLEFEPGRHTFDVEFPSELVEPCEGELRSGCELSGTLTSIGLDDSPAPVSGVEVRLVDPNDGRVISSASTVREGEFAVRVAPFEGDYDLQVVPGPSGSPYRATTFGAVNQLASLDLLIRRYPAVRYEAIVLDARTHEPVPLATVAFQSDPAPDPVSGASSVYRTSTLSGEGAEAGLVEVDLQPGVFKVRVTPVETQDLAIHVGEVIIPDAEGTDVLLGQAFELGPRASLRVQLTTFDGLPLDLVDVEASPRIVDLARTSDAAPFARTSRATTDEEGKVRLPIDLGVFDLLARPDSTRGFAHAWAPRIEVDAPGHSLGREVIVQAPTVLAGTVRTSGGEPLGGATIRATVEVEGELGPRLIRMGETRSEADGGYRLLLPSNL